MKFTMLRSSSVYGVGVFGCHGFSVQMYLVFACCMYVRTLRHSVNRCTAVLACSLPGML